MVDANYNFDECLKEMALWAAKKEVIEWIVHEIEYTSKHNNDFSDTYKAYYISALELLSEGITEYGILPW